MARETNEQLQHKIGGLKHEIGALEREIEEIKEHGKTMRTQLSKALGGLVIDRDMFTREIKTKSMSWIEIAVAIGELKADANYAMVLEARDDFKQQLQIVDQFSQAQSKVIQNYRLGLDDPEEPLQGSVIPKA